MILSIEEQRWRDDLAFDPLPPSRWVRVADDGIRIAVRYSEPLSRLLRGLPGAKWLPDDRCWRVPFSARKAVEAALPEINRLAELAQASADEQTRRIEQERAERAARAIAERQERERQAALSRPRPLRHEYLIEIAGAPQCTLELEAIGDDLAQMARSAGDSYSRCWVAQIFGVDGRGNWVRAYLRGMRDYSRANSVGSRGVFRTYILSQGPIYEVSAPVSWRRTDRYFLRIVDGERRRMTEDEVKACLEP